MRNWTGLAPHEVIRAVHSLGLAFNQARGTGVVLHMPSGLSIDGRFGLTAIGRDQVHDLVYLHVRTPAARCQRSVASERW
jgi:hypothetical protein